MFRPILFLVLPLLLAGMAHSQGSARVATAQKASLQIREQFRNEVMRFGDEYLLRLSNAFDELEEGSDRDELIKWIQQMLLTNSTAVFQISASERPYINLLDMVVMVTLTRWEVETHWSEKFAGESLKPVVSVLSELEADIWLIAERAFKETQIEELKALIAEWIRKNPNTQYTSNIRFREFLTLIGEEEEVRRSRSNNSIFSLLYLDPLAGLDPTLRAIEETKMFGERAMYYSQRLPALLRMQSQLLLRDVTRTTEVQQSLENVARFSLAIESIARTVERLPEVVAQEREAAIEQVFAALNAERDQLMTLLEGQEVAVNRILLELQKTLDSGSALSGSLTTTFTTFDQLMEHFQLDPDSERSGEPGEPFRILDYAETAQRIETAARELNQLLQSLDRSLPETAAASTTALKAVANHIFRLCAALVLLIFALSIAYRFALKANTHLRKEC